MDAFYMHQSLCWKEDVPFYFDNDCLVAFEHLKKALTTAPIIQSPNLEKPFQIMCDASDYVVGAILGQQDDDKKFVVIHYACRKLSSEKKHYTTLKKEFLAVVFACDKFRFYILNSKVIVHTNHRAMCYPLCKKDAKPQLIRWVLLLQEFDLLIVDRRGKDNLVADHLSRHGGVV
jgi:hypothetical protein